MLAKVTTAISCISGVNFLLIWFRLPLLIWLFNLLAEHDILLFCFIMNKLPERHTCF